MAHQGYVAWPQFVAEVYYRFEYETHHLGHLTKLKKSRIVKYFIFAFEHLDLRMEGMSYAFFKECFINGIKYEIDAHVLIAHPQTWL
jgi:hypothetical protein